MTIRKEYFEYLRHLGSTEPVSALHSKKDAPDLIALRHDVDHDLDVALEMAYWEAEGGYRATYFLLHTADYWHDPRFIDKCLQLQDFGHEVGLHINLLTRWFAGEIDDVAVEIASLVGFMQQNGIRITGVSAHGDRACYKYQFSNYWCFRELRPVDPELQETGLSAEGISPEDPRHALQYPSTHQLTRPDGATFPLWSISLKECGLAYDAMHVPFDRYFTDSGGGWLRSPDPMTATMKNGRHEVLFHPEHWRDKARQYFFLSTARSGSTWLTKVLDSASSVQARHEYALNHYNDSTKMVLRKETGAGFTRLVEQREKVVSLLADFRTEIENYKRDYAEVNIYLEQCIPELKNLFPDASFVQLVRHPADVVRSIMNREWYATPNDDQHPAVNVPAWEELKQFDKCCLYVADVMARLAVACLSFMRLEDIAPNQERLKKLLQNLGIAFYPRLAEPLYGVPLNVNSTDRVPPINQWGMYQRWQFWKKCGGAMDQFYRDKELHLSRSDTLFSFVQRLRNSLVRKLRKTISLRKNAIHTTQDMSSAILADVHLQNDGQSRVRMLNLRSEMINQHFNLSLENPGRHGYVTLGGSPWKRINKNQGWACRQGHYFELFLDAEAEGQGEAQVLVLCFGRDNELRTKKNLAYLRPHSVTHAISYRAPEDIERIDLAIYIQKEQPQLILDLKGFRLLEHSLIA